MKNDGMLVFFGCCLFISGILFGGASIQSSVEVDCNSLGKVRIQEKSYICYPEQRKETNATTEN